MGTPEGREMLWQAVKIYGVETVNELASILPRLMQGAKEMSGPTGAYRRPSPDAMMAGMQAAGLVAIGSGPFAPRGAVGAGSTRPLYHPKVNFIAFVGGERISGIGRLMTRDDGSRYVKWQGSEIPFENLGSMTQVLSNAVYVGKPDVRGNIYYSGGRGGKVAGGAVLEPSEAQAKPQRAGPRTILDNILR